MKSSYKIFPVGPDKAPLIAGWQDRATRDGYTIAQWEAQGVVAWGIPCGAYNGLFVIDLDVDKASGEPVGEANMSAMSRYADLLDKTNVRTPSGGRHLYCQHFDGGRNTTSKIGSKIDTRGQGGYVVAPGSQVLGGVYQGFFPDILPTVPMGLRALLLHTFVAPARSFERQTPISEVEEMLSHIPSDLPYKDWL